MRRVRRAAAKTGALPLGIALLVAPAAAAESCPPEAGQPRAVARILDPVTLALDDGTELRLTGILAPGAPDIPGGAANWSPAAAAQAATERHLDGAMLRPASSPTARDRYGRLLAQAFAARDGTLTWLQGALIDEGHARVAPLPGETACASALLAREAVARAARKGLWQNPAYAVREARQTRRLMGLLGTFQIVEGRISAVGETRTRIYLNFGDNWRWDFTAAVPAGRTPERAGLVERLKTLAGRYVRVRGWLVRRNGPYMELATPGIIEAISDGEAGSAATR